jgi:hypothetical protein
VNGPRNALRVYAECCAGRIAGGRNLLASPAERSGEYLGQRQGGDGDADFSALVPLEDRRESLRKNGMAFQHVDDRRRIDQHQGTRRKGADV